MIAGIRVDTSGVYVSLRLDLNGHNRHEKSIDWTKKPKWHIVTKKQHSCLLRAIKYNAILFFRSNSYSGRDPIKCSAISLEFPYQAIPISRIRVIIYPFWASSENQSNAEHSHLCYSKLFHDCVCKWRPK